MQELGGDLASVPSFAVQKFLMDTFQDLDKDKWLGGKQSGGAFTWVTGDTYLYQNNKCDFSLSSDKPCLKMSGGDSGQWDGEDCSSTLDTFICQKGILEDLSHYLAKFQLQAPLLLSFGTI